MCIIESNFAIGSPIIHTPCSSTRHRLTFVHCKDTASWKYLPNSIVNLENITIFAECYMQIFCIGVKF